MESVIKTVEILSDCVRLLDQRKLPLSEEYVDCRTYQEVAEAITTMVVRGAPAIGVAAAAGIALGVQQLQMEPGAAFAEQFGIICDTMARTRCARQHSDAPLVRLRQALMTEAQRLLREDVQINRQIGHHGLVLVPPHSTVLTHCNAGALATAGYGTALGIIRAAHFAGRHVQVVADETRPFLQGARLTNVIRSR
jgi:methylthioribose-1-phosphate isomerase